MVQRAQSGGDLNEEEDAEVSVVADDALDDDRNPQHDRHRTCQLCIPNIAS